MTPAQQAAIIADAFITAIVRAEIWSEARPELAKQLELYAKEVEGDIEPDAFDQMCVDVARVWLLHLKALAGEDNTRPVPVTLNVMRDLEELARLRNETGGG